MISILGNGRNSFSRKQDAGSEARMEGFCESHILNNRLRTRRQNNKLSQTLARAAAKVTKEQNWSKQPNPVRSAL